MMTNGADQKNSVTKKRVAAIGRWMPIHNGHKEFLIRLAKDETVEKLVVMIGSCYENGRQRYCIPAVEREKMIEAIFQAENIPEERYEIIHMPDKETFEEWMGAILKAFKKYKITHFCTGNKEDILNALEGKEKSLGFEIINPETQSEISYHATELRKLILEGDYEKLETMIPNEVKQLLFHNTFKEIIACSKNNGIKFVPGRQSVDIVFLVRNTIDGKVYVLLGKRSNKKVDFPGYFSLMGTAIKQEDFESPINAAIRGLQECAGIKVKMLDNSLEPAIISMENIPKANLEQMNYIGLYSSEDEKFAGTRGGSSQCFGIFIEDEIFKYEEYLKAGNDLENVAFYDISTALSELLAYQHKDMLKKAITMFNAYPDLIKQISSLSKMEAEKKAIVISFVGAPGAGKSTAALGLSYELKKKAKNVEYVQEFAKDLTYNNLLEKYIPNQSYIIAEQYKKIYDLVEQVDYIVTDAGIEISAFHASQESKVVENLAWYLRNKTEQITIFIERDKDVKYDRNGRIESEQESQEIGEGLENYLQQNNVNYYKVVGTQNAINKALELIKNKEM